jgi:hypothetical protein
MITVQISNTWCDEHLTRCWQSYDESTGEHRHIKYYSDERDRLQAAGYYYAGHHGGVYTYQLRKSSPLAQPGLDWQIAIDAKAARSTTWATRQAQLLAELGYS